ncbi:hypothetical protein KCP74_10585 [Salmonella enterica subsp. enterica]|nr:hypothetical protein KCP74_10585 [Salmonella enterica subsp. enterica]
MSELASRSTGAYRSEQIAGVRQLPSLAVITLTSVIGYRHLTWLPAGKHGVFRLATRDFHRSAPKAKTNASVVKPRR